ncbi:MAG: hypothetical protein ACI89L_002844 [Phycisphaerales bacterium]|jgi:uncharacterized protein YqgC (DUF456 family)
MTALAATLVILFSWLGVVVTLLTLPGTWIAVLAALLVKWWQPELLGWWAIGIAAGLAVVGELIEFGAGAVGSKAAGGSKSGAWGALVGGLIGSVLGTVFIPIPIVGTILGAVLGAGLGAVTTERGVAQRTWKESVKSGSGAAAGRAFSVIAKGAVAAVIAVVLTLAVLIPGF